MNAEELLRSLAGDIRALLQDSILSDDVTADLRAAIQALERAAARLENAP